MIDGNLVRLVAEAGEIGGEDLVIEVGPGTGSLTGELLRRARRVVAVEIDRDLAGLLRQTMGENAKLRLIEGDALASKHALNAELAGEIEREIAAGRRPKLVANLPYNIASPLIIELLIAGCGLLVFTVQREVAQRLRAPAGSGDYGPLSVMAQLLAEVELLRVLPPQAFWPAPKVESALVRMRRRGDAEVLAKRARPLGAFVQAVFSSRRKTLRNALGKAVPGADAEAIIASQHLAAEVRPEALTPGQFLSLFDAARAASGP
jgi:16S rRNA (adenine1518-N6/adenine1519-N6)-dimethyltransferase